MVWIVSQSFYSWIIVLIYSKCCTLTGWFILAWVGFLGGGWLGCCSCPTPSPKKPGQARFIPAHMQVLVGHLSTLKVYEVQAFYSSPYLFNVK